MPTLTSLPRQFIKYLLVGGFSNVLAYCLYLAFSNLGYSPLISMSFVYFGACGVTFAANKLWTFKSDALLSRTLLKYIAIQFFGYATNLVLLTGLHYVMGVPHHLAQLLSIAIVAIELFALSRYYVFT